MEAKRGSIGIRHQTKSTQAPAAEAPEASRPSKRAGIVGCALSALALAAAIGLFGCGGTATGPSNATATDEAAGTTSGTDSSAGASSQEVTPEAVDPVGTWDIIELEVNGVVYKEKALKASGEHFVNLYEDGSVIMRNEKSDVAGTWERTGSDQLTWTFSNGQIVMKIKGSEAICTSGDTLAMTLRKSDVAKDIENAGQEETPAPPEGDGSTTADSDSQAQEDDGDAVGADLKEALDSYEAFIDEYIAFMQKYKSSEDTSALMLDYLNFLSRYADLSKKIGDMESEDMTDAERAYYLEVTARCAQKLLEASLD